MKSLLTALCLLVSTPAWAQLPGAHPGCIPFPRGTTCYFDMTQVPIGEHVLAVTYMGMERKPTTFYMNVSGDTADRCGPILQTRALRIYLTTPYGLDDDPFVGMLDGQPFVLAPAR